MFIRLSILLVLAAFPIAVRAENPCKSGAYLELSRMDPDSLTGRQFANLLKYREKCEEYQEERSKKIEQNKKEDYLTDLIHVSILLGGILLLITAFRF